jgi:hypothetical protein
VRRADGAWAHPLRSEDPLWGGTVNDVVLATVERRGGGSDPGEAGPRVVAGAIAALRESRETIRVAG